MAAPPPSATCTIIDTRHPNIHIVPNLSGALNNLTVRGSPGHDNGTDITGEPHADETMEEQLERSLQLEGPSQRRSPSPTYGGTVRSPSRLEGLPPEIRTQILLAIPDLATLRSAVTSSTVLHAQYLYSRDAILRECLGREMQGYLVDAYATAMSHAGRIPSPRTNQVVAHFLEEYTEWRSCAAPVPDQSTVEPDILREMAAHHFAVVRPVARLYIEWALANLRAAAETAAHEPQVAPPGGFDNTLSRTEEIRLFRALYRYETFHHLFGHPDKGRRAGRYYGEGINEIFFCPLDPWEAEATGCIDLFVREKYTTIFDQVQWDLEPNREWGIDLIILREYYMDGTIGRGLETTVRLLAIEDHGELVSEVKRSVIPHDGRDSSMNEALSAGANFDRRMMSTNFPHAKDEAQERQDLISFEGDDIGAVDSPPLGWVLLWGGKYTNVYGEYVPEALRRSGYAIWDEERWNRIGAAASELVAKQWEAAPALVEDVQQEFGWNPLHPEVASLPSFFYRERMWEL